MRLCFTLSFLLLALLIPAQAQLVITEFVYDVCNASSMTDGSGGSNNGEYLVVYNSGAAPVDISGFEIDDDLTPGGGNMIPAGTTPLPPGGNAIICPCTQAQWVGEYGAVPAGATFVSIDGIPSWGALNNGGDSIYLQTAINNGTYADLVGDGEAMVWDGTGFVAAGANCVPPNANVSLTCGGGCYVPASTGPDGNEVADCPDLTAASPGAATITESTCQADGTTIDGGVITAPATACPADSTLMYSIDGGTTWSATAPAYNQTMAITVMTRCECDRDDTVFSPSSMVDTVPGECAPMCSINGIANIVVGPCQPDGTYTLTFDVTYANPMGALNIDVNGIASSVAAPGATMESVTVAGLPADGTPIMITVTFAGDAACTMMMDGGTAPSVPTITADPVAVCVGDAIDIVFTATGAMSVDVSGAATAAGVNSPYNVSAAATTADAGMYTFSAMSADGCLAAVVVDVTVNQGITEAGGNQAVCVTDGMIDLTMNPGATPGTWSGPNVTSTGMFDASAAGAGTYTFTLTGSDPDSGCESFDTMTVTVNDSVNEISGVVRWDADLSGTQDTGEPGLAGATIRLYTDPNGDGSIADGVLINIATTAGNGAYSFGGLGAGSYVVVESDPAPYFSTVDVNGGNNNVIPVEFDCDGIIAARSARAGLTTAACDFWDGIPVTNVTEEVFEDCCASLLVRTYEVTVCPEDPPMTCVQEVRWTNGTMRIEGFVRLDDECNAGANPGDDPIPGATIQLWSDPDGDGSFADGMVVATTTTDPSGLYTFTGLTDEHYIVVQQDLPGYWSTADSGFPTDNPNVVAVNMVCCEDTLNVNFWDTLPRTTVTDTLFEGCCDTTIQRVYEIFNECDCLTPLVCTQIINYTSDTARIEGFVYVDDCAGVGQTTTPIPGSTVELWTDPNCDGSFADGAIVSTTVTDPSGLYAFAGLTDPCYIVVQQDLPGYWSTSDAGAPTTNANVVAVNIECCEDTRNINFYDTMPMTNITDTVVDSCCGSTIFREIEIRNICDCETLMVCTQEIAFTSEYARIEGFVRKDDNCQGQDTGDAGITNVTLTLYLDPNCDGFLDDAPIITTTTTDSTGAYAFTGLVDNCYVVVETDPAGHHSTSDIGFPANPNTVAVNMECCEDTLNVDFWDACPVTNITDTIVEDCCTTVVFRVHEVSNLPGCQTLVCTQRIVWTNDVLIPACTNAGPFYLGCNPTPPVPNVSAFEFTNACDVSVTFVGVEAVTNGCMVFYTNVYSAADECGNSITCHQAFVWTEDLNPPVITNFPTSIDLGCNPSADDIALALGDMGDAMGGGGGDPGLPWINEFHYDNAGGDVDECIEVAGPAGTDLSTYSLILYNGNGGAMYSMQILSGTIANTANGFGTLCFCFGSIQNGGPDGFALVNGATVIEFLSYEGSFTATDGPANGMTSTDIGVFETGVTPVGQSLQLTGSGTNSADFTWNAPAASSCGAPNAGQTFTGAAAPASGPSFGAFDECEICTETLICATNIIGCEVVVECIFTVVDCCGNLARREATIRWTDDEEAPTITCPPGADLGCNPIIPAPDPLATNVVVADVGCGIRDVAHVGDSFTYESCATTLERIYRVTDECGNVASCTQTFSFISDQSPPEVVLIPTDIELGCSINPLDIPAPGDQLAIAVDNCNLVSTQFLSDVTTTQGCQTVIVRTYEFEDECGNLRYGVQTIRYSDTNTVEAPVCSAEGAFYLGCNPSIPPPDPSRVAPFSECGIISVDFSHFEEGRDGCLVTRTNVYIATDICFQTVTCREVLVWTEDTDAPILTAFPGNVTSLACIEDVTNPPIPAPDTNAIACVDDCDGVTAQGVMALTITNVISSQVVTRTEIEITQPFAINEVYANVEGGIPEGDGSGNDDGGEFVELIGPPGIPLGCYMITDGDFVITIPPGTVMPADGIFLIASSGYVSPAGTAYTAIDLDVASCGCINSPVAADEFIFTNGGEYLGVYDPMGNFQFGWEFGSPSAGNTPPSIAGGTDDYPKASPAVVGCTVFNLNGAASGYTPTISGGLADAQSVQDTDAGFVEGLPSPGVLNADQTLMSVTNVMSETTLVEQVVTTFELITNDVSCNVRWIGDFTNVSPCAIEVERLWRVSDACGNSVERSQFFTYPLNDNVAPDFTYIPPSQDLGCNPGLSTNAPPASILGASDAICGVDFVFMQTNEVTQLSDCVYSQMIIYVARDTCNNRSTATVSRTWTQDLSPPVLTACPDNQNIGCFPDAAAASAFVAGIPPQTNEVLATDDCMNWTATFLTDRVKTLGCDGTITRQFRLMDDCGNSIDHDQLFHFNLDDGTGPVLDALPPLELGCINELSDIPSPDTTGRLATDVCDVVVTFVGDVTVGPPCDATLTRTYMATDTCGNESTVDQTITYSLDRTEPVISGGPARVADLDCITDISQVPAADIALITATDDCGMFTVEIVLDVTNQVIGTCQYRVDRTYHVVDPCGNLVDYNQHIRYVLDTADPVIDFAASMPTDVTLPGCNPVIPAPNPAGIVASDDCGVASIAYIGQSRDLGGCESTITRTFVVSDNCGKTATFTQTINYYDDRTAPIVDIVPAEINLGCAFDLADVPPPEASVNLTNDNCIVSQIGSTDHVTTQGCLVVVDRIYEFADDCGNRAFGVQTFRFSTAATVAPPTCSAEPVFDLGCNPTVPPPDTSRVSPASGCGIVRVDFIHHTQVTNGCLISRTNVYESTDICGQTVLCTESFIWTEDVTPPTIVTFPGNVRETCIDADNVPVPAADTSLVICQDDCPADGLVIIGSETSLVTNVVIDTETSIVTNITTSNMTVDVLTTNITGGSTTFVTNVMDVVVLVTNLTMIATPMTNTVLRTVTNPVFGVSGAGCDVTWVGDTTNRTDCLTSVTRYYRIQDNCGNWIERRQLLNFQHNDGEAPVLLSGPLDQDLGCNPAVIPVPGPGDFAFEDEGCGGLSVFISRDEMIRTDPCNLIREIEATARDACGNAATNVVTVTWTDDPDAPALVIPNVQLGCNNGQAGFSIPAVATDAASLAATIGGSVTDLCGIASLVLVGDSTELDGCDVTITRTYRATDNCGQATTASHTIRYKEASTPPQIVCIPSKDLGCNPPKADILDNDTIRPLLRVENTLCEYTIDLLSDTLDEVGCESTRTLTFTVTDECGNSSASCPIVQTWRTDIKPPVITATQPEGDLGCNGQTNIPPVDIASIQASDEGCGVMAITHEGDVRTTNDCFMTLRRTYRVMDLCGNFADEILTYTYRDDTEAPLIVGGPDRDILLGCNPGTIPPANPNEWSVIDNCGSASVTWLSDSTPVNDCGIQFDRLYEIADDCGNRFVVTQRYTYTTDTAPPVINVAPVFMDLGCNPSVIPTADQSLSVLSDGCLIVDNGVTETFVTNANCEVILTRQYAVEDVCGNIVRAGQTLVWIEDNIAPVVGPGTTAVDTFLGCNPVIPFPNPQDIDGFDNCGEVDVTHIGDSTAIGSCGQTLTRLYLLEDPCGNMSYHTQTFTYVEDETPPELAIDPPLLELGCSPEDIPGPLDLVVLGDNCGLISTQMIDAVRTTNDCTITMVRSYTFQDACLNEIGAEQTITWTVDDEPPTAMPAPVIDLGCNPDFPEPDPDSVDASDDCESLTVAHLRDNRTTTDCDVSVDRIYRLADACGNVALHTQAYTFVEDDSHPDLTIEVPVLDLGCNPETLPGPFDFVLASDNCGFGAPPTVSSVRTTNNCTITMVRTYSYTDICGNKSTARQTITWTEDTEPPTAQNVVSDLGCDLAVLPPPNPLAILTDDNCSDVIAQFISDQEVISECAVSVLRTYQLIDACGNRSIHVEQYNFTRDDTPPVLSLDPPVIDLGCEGVDVPGPDPSAVMVFESCELVSSNFIGDTIVTTDCEIVITRTYEFTDVCGNAIPAERDFIITRSIQPSISLPETLNLGCSPSPVDIPTEATIRGLAQARSGCRLSEIQVSLVPGTNNCERSLTAIANITNACGLIAESDPMVITWTEDSDMPLVARRPVGGSLGCAAAADVPTVADDIAAFDVLDTCGVEISLLNETSSEQGCMTVVARNYLIADACGNRTAEDVVYTYTRDTTPPMVSLPGDLDLACNPRPADIPSLNALRLLVDADDDCADITDINVDFVAPATGPVTNGCDVSMTIQATAANRCGLTGESAPMTITWTVDTEPPVITGKPGDQDLGCAPATPPAPNPASVTATDNYGTPVVTHVGDIETRNDCQVLIIRTYRVSDACGNEIDTEVRYTYTDDSTAPAITCPPDIKLFGESGCVAIIPDLRGDATVTDACGSRGDIRLTQSPVPGGEVLAGVGPVTITIAAVDACDNRATCETTLTVICQPSMELKKTAYLGHDGGASCPGEDFAFDFPGEPVTFCFEIINNGETHLSNLMVTDDAITPPFSATIPGILAPGESAPIQFTERIIGDMMINTAAGAATPVDETGTELGLPDLTMETEGIEIGPGRGRLGDTVWIDLTNDGSPDNENLRILGVPGVTLNLFRLEDGTNVLRSTTVTTENGDNRGFYEFGDLPPGTYTVEVDTDNLPADLETLNTTTPMVLTATIGADGETNFSIAEDFGFSPTPTAVTVSSIEATGGILTWIVSSEDGTLGYNVLDAVGEPINDQLILSGAADGIYQVEVDVGTYTVVELTTDLDAETVGTATQYVERDATPVDGETATVDAADILVVPESAANLLITGLDASAIVLDITHPDAVVRLIGHELESDAGSALYLAVPPGATLAIQ